jgi:hypothetical protein
VKRLLGLVAILVGLLSVGLVAPASAAEATCTRPVSNAEALYVISNQLPGKRQSQAYWWSKTDLTIGIEASPNVDPDHYAAVERAIRTWQATVDQCLGGEVTLIYVPIQPGSLSRTDIVFHLSEHAGGLAFGGFAHCGPSGCNNVIVSYLYPPGILGRDGNPEIPLWATEGYALHEIGHALGLGHATNLEESTDLMGYGWLTPDFGRVPTISQCDVDALAYVWSWALEATEPTKPTDLTYQCG